MARREFHFTDGTSNKFWAIDLAGDKCTVHYGRIGTSGQAQEKSYASADLAKREHDKLIAEKTKKGYVETEAEATTSMPVPVAKAASESVRKPKAAAETVVDEKPEPAAAELTAAPVFSGTLDRSIALDATDRLAVTWETHPTKTKPAAPEFQVEKALERLKSVEGHSSSWWYCKWENAKIPDFPSAEEATFWLRAYALCLGEEIGPKEAAKRLEDPAARGPLSFDEIVAAYEEPWRCAQLFACIAALLSLEELLLFLEKQPPETHYGYYGRDLNSDFRLRVFPYLSVDERSFVKTWVAPKIPPAGPVNCHCFFPPLYYVAALVGCHAELAAVVAEIPDQQFVKELRDYCGSAQWLTFGLPDRQSVVSEWRRIAYKIRTIPQGRAWLALTEHEALGALAEAACEAGTKEDSIKLASLIELVVSPEAALPALQIMVSSKAPQFGSEWLRKHPLHAVVGLVPAAAGTGKLAQAAREYLQTMRRGDGLAVLEAATTHLPAETSAWLKREVIDSQESQLADAPLAALPDDLRAAFEATPKAKLPPWVQPASLPPIKVGESKLATAEVATLLGALKSSPLGSPVPLFDALKKHAVRTSLDGFVWKLYETWTSMGAPSKEKWAMGALGQLGGDAVVLKLTPLVRQWPGESQHPRAVFGLECLRVIGSDTALMALNGIAQKLKFKGLKEKAQAMMQGIAESRGMSREELADRIVPDCGLDARGGRTFDFGPRQFQFVLGPEMKPLIKDAAGKIRPDLPSPNQSDERAKAEAEVAEWKLLKKTLKEVLKIQAERLEESMITGRRWSPEEFDTLLVKHPLMINLVRQLVFAAYEDGKIVRSFRVTEDQTIADENDDEIPLPEAGRIGVVHPAHLSESAKSAWGQVMSDYEIIPPFQQLGRAICHPEPGDLDLDELTRFRGPKMPGITVYGMLEKNHWLRDTPADGGGFSQHSKFFPSADVTAFIAYTGMGIAYYDEPQEIESVYFVPGHEKPEMWGHHTVRVKIKDVDPVVLSEVLRLVHAILSKAE